MIKTLWYASVTLLFFSLAQPAFADKPIDGFEAHPPIHVKGPENGNGHQSGALNTTAFGLSPTQVKAAYGLPTSLTAGTGKTIAIVDAYYDPNIANDLAKFSAQFGLPSCTTQTGCLTIHTMVPRIKYDQGWGLEASLDTEWAHAIAPGAKILYVVARSASGTDLLNAVDYARSHANVVSMIWGGGEFAGESSYDSYFTGAGFFASSGDSGAGVEWPAVSANVTGVGGTTLAMSGNTVTSETAWAGSGGGVSAFVAKPAYQAALLGSQRSVPDVSYDADPNTGFPVYDSFGYQGRSGWFEVGGTSAGAPQWAAIYAIGGNVTNAQFYADAANPALYATTFRDITAGSNGNAATVGYDLVTGLGSPITVAL